MEQQQDMAPSTREDYKEIIMVEVEEEEATMEEEEEIIKVEGAALRTCRC